MTKILLNDYNRCAGQSCERKLECLRHTCKGTSEYMWQSATMMAEDETECDYFITNKGENFQ